MGRPQTNLETAGLFYNEYIVVHRGPLGNDLPILRNAFAITHINLPKSRTPGPRGSNRRPSARHPAALHPPTPDPPIILTDGAARVKSMCNYFPLHTILPRSCGRGVRRSYPSLESTAGGSPV